MSPDCLNLNQLADVTPVQWGETGSEAVEYSEAFKAKMVQKMLGPNGKSASALADEVGMSQPTLSRWLREAGSVASMSKSKRKGKRSKARPESKRWTRLEKLRVVFEASSLSDEELGAFLRREGLHEAQLNEWREAAREAFEGAGRRRRKASDDSKRIKELERELRRKEKALAEVSALLVLKKKLNALWGDEDDDTNGRTGK